MDAASHGGVDDARDLRERAAFAPVRDRYKVFIIDEAHMVTTQGFNALLKLVEEPPEHVKFIFATTEPEKVIGTIRSRTHHYPFRLVPPDVLEPFLRTICDREGVTADDGVLNLVIRAGGGSVRDTLSVLDQLMAGMVDARLDYPTTVALLGYTDTALLDQTVDALAGGDGAAVYRVIERMVDSGHEPRRFAEDFLQRLRDLLIIAVAGDGADDVLAGTPSDQLERMKVQAKNWGPGPLSRAADLTDQALRGMVGATSPRLQLELLIGRILVPEPGRVATGAGGAVSGGSDVASYPGTVGMAGGGAPRGSQFGPLSSAGDQPDVADSGFGAVQAREHLRRSRAAGSGVQADSSMQAPDQRRHRGSQSVSGGSTGDRSSTLDPTTPREGLPMSSPGGPSLPGWDEPVAVVPGASFDHEGPTRAAGAGAPASPASRDSSQGASRRTPGAATARDADMLRDRWPEVIQRLSSISRASWSLIDQNGQLGGVDGSTAVVVFPTAGLVGAFVTGNRGPDLERAIREATGLTLSVRAQVGQAGGGGPVTTPTAVAGQPPDGEPRAQEHPQVPTAREQRTEPPRQSRPSGSGTADVVAAATLEVSQGQQALPRSAPDESSDSLMAAPVMSASSSAPAAASLTGISPDAPARSTPWTSGWTEAVVAIPGSGSTGLAADRGMAQRVAPVFDEDQDREVARHSQPPPSRRRTADTAVESPSTGRAAGDHRTDRPTVPVVAPAQDMSASFDDPNAANSTLIGLPAVLEILGGVVVEEIDHKED